MIKISDKLKDVRFDISEKALSKFNPNIRMEAESDNAIEIYGEIDRYAYGLEYLDYKLSQVGNKDVDILINSAGGSLFEGVAMYNRLKLHKGKVTVKVIGIAASSASIIAMAGDDLQIAKTASIMIHNGSVLAYGNKEDFRAIAEELEPFDNNIAELYHDITGISVEEIKAMMTNETFLIGKQAIEMGFATSLIEDEIKEVENKAEISAHRIDTIMAKAGVSRKERRELIKDVKNISDTHDAITKTSTQDAAKKSNVDLF